jgi:hypothetical protein
MSWMKGPLPAGTYNWGGVVPKGMTGGFLFADFAGDHVMAYGLGTEGKRIEAADVEWYDNHLELPPCCLKGVGSRLTSLLVMFALLLLGGTAPAAEPLKAPPVTVDDRLGKVEGRTADLERRLAALEQRLGVSTAPAPSAPSAGTIVAYTGTEVGRNWSYPAVTTGPAYYSSPVNYSAGSFGAFGGDCAGGSCGTSAPARGGFFRRR